ncbi:MAG: flagellar biosynthetic protein FliR [Deltaproteobacteria bacterium]|nr:flagellar biosynthetic protein FliR [Deltaproteobacteria bacterium]
MFSFTTSQAFLDRLGLHIDLFRYLLIGGLIFTRIFVLALFVPFLGGRPVPGRIRITVAFALTMFLYIPISGAAPATIPQTGGVLFAFFLKEMLVGILLGMPLAFMFYGIQSAGNMIDNQRQLANARIFNPALGAQASLFGVFFYQVALVSFITIGGHRMFIQGLAQSFETVPVLGLPPVQEGLTPLLELVIRLTADTLVICLQLSAPILVAIFIADLILGLTNRVAPMINVFEMGFNIKGFVGMALAYVSFPLIYEQMKVWFLKTLAAIEQIQRLFLK